MSITLMCNYIDAGPASLSRHGNAQSCKFKSNKFRTDLDWCEKSMDWDQKGLSCYMKENMSSNN